MAKLHRDLPWWVAFDPKTSTKRFSSREHAPESQFVVGDLVKIKAKPERVRKVLEIIWHFERSDYCYLIETSTTDESRNCAAYWFFEQLERVALS